MGRTLDLEQETARYLDETVRVMLGLADPDVAVPELPDRLARLLLRVEEYERTGRDRWGCWDYRFSENFQAGRLWEPEIDRWLADRRAELDGTTQLEPLWPDGRRFAVCLTHDVDLIGPQLTAAQLVRYARAGMAPGAPDQNNPLGRIARPPLRLARTLRRGIARAPSARDGLERCVALESERGIVSSYLFTVPPARRSRYDCVYSPSDPCSFRGRRMRVVDIMRTLAKEGFDVGLHGSYRAALDPGALTEERDALEIASGLEVTTTRQHFLHWEIRTTPALQEQAKLRVDSTLGFNANVGFRAGTSLPFHHFDVGTGRPLALLEVPLVIQDGALLGPEGLGLGLPEAREIVRQLFDSIAEVGGLATLLVHPDKLALPGWLGLYQWALDYGLEQGAWVTSLRRLADWWLGREARVLAA
jgi:hypothetical protein